MDVLNLPAASTRRPNDAKIVVTAIAVKAELRFEHPSFLRKLVVHVHTNVAGTHSAIAITVAEKQITGSPIAITANPPLNRSKADT